MGRKSTALLGLALGLLLCLSVFRSWSDSRVNRATFDKIALGMPQGQVEALLGGPPGDYGASKLGPVDQTGGAGLLLELGRVERWMGRQAFIAVEFDADGMVTAKELQEVRDSTPSWMARVFGWMGL